MAAWANYSQDTLVFKSLIEIGDGPSATYRWATDPEIREYLDEFNDLLQDELWLLSTTTQVALGSGTSTYALTTDVLRVQQATWQPATSTETSLLVPRTEEDLYLYQSDWASKEDLPKASFYPAYGTLAVWPSPSQAGTLGLTYLRRFRWTVAADASPFPAWTREWPQIYVAYKVYSKFGALQDLPRAAAYRRAHEHNLQVGRKLRDTYFPLAASGVLRPSGNLQGRILTPDRRLY